MDTLVIHCPKLLITNTGNQLEQMIIYRVIFVNILIMFHATLYLRYLIIRMKIVNLINRQNMLANVHRLTIRPIFVSYFVDIHHCPMDLNTYRDGIISLFVSDRNILILFNNYFLATSTGSLNGLNNSYGGLCQTKNLRLKISMIPHNNRRTKNGDNRRINGINS